MLDANMKQQLGTYLNNLRNPIELKVSVNDSPKSKELEELAQEIAQLNDKISLTTTRDAIDGRSPVMTIAKAGSDARVAFRRCADGARIYLTGIGIVAGQAVIRRKKMRRYRSRRNPDPCAEF